MCLFSEWNALRKKRSVEDMDPASLNLAGYTLLDPAKLPPVDAVAFQDVVMAPYGLKLSATQCKDYNARSGNWTTDACKVYAHLICI